MPGPPIRKPSDHSPPAGSPRNIAGHHVLHRPLMPRHPPNAQKNKQQKTHEQNKKQFCRRNLTVRCSRPLYSSQPTHPHPHPTTHKQGSRTRVRQPGRTAPEPRQHATPTHAKARGGTHHQRTTTTTRPQQPTTAGVFPTPLTRQPTPPARNKPHETRSATRPSARASTPAGPDPSTAQTTHDQEATPTQIPILRKEVIQPHLPVRLPCYDFVPITSPTFDRSP